MCVSLLVAQKTREGGFVGSLSGQVPREVVTAWRTQRWFLISILPISDLVDMEGKMNEKWSPGAVCPSLEIEAGSGPRKN